MSISAGSRKLLWFTIIGLFSVVFIDLKINDNNICVFYVNNTFKIPTSTLSNELFNFKIIPQDYLSEAIPVHVKYKAKHNQCASNTHEFVSIII